MVQLNFVGDIAFNHASSERWLAEDVRAVLASGLTVGNLECVLVDPQVDAGERLVVQGHTSAAGLLRDAMISVVSLANNHIMDLDADGLRSTLDALDAAGVGHFGAGVDEAMALAPLIVESQGARVGFVGRQDPESHAPATNPYASASTPGPARFDLEETLAAGRRLRAEGCDHTVCFLHWGVQKVPFLPDWLVEPTRRLMEVFDVVAGSHAHTLYPVWTTAGAVAPTGLGNFYFAPLSWRGDWYYDAAAVDRVAVVCTVHVGAGRPPQVRLRPTVQGLGPDYAVRLLGGPAGAAVTSFLRRAPAHDPRVFRAAWRAKEVAALARYTLKAGPAGLARHVNADLPRKLLRNLRDPQSR